MRALALRHYLRQVPRLPYVPDAYTAATSIVAYYVMALGFMATAWLLLLNMLNGSSTVALQQRPATARWRRQTAEWVPIPTTQ